jgi:hypothetical protein
MNPEAIRRILKSKWKPKPEEEEDRVQRWKRYRQERKSKFTDGVLTEFYEFRKDATLLRKYRPGFKEDTRREEKRLERKRRQEQYERRQRRKAEYSIDEVPRL